MKYEIYWFCDRNKFDQIVSAHIDPSRDCLRDPIYLVEAGICLAFFAKSCSMLEPELTGLAFLEL